MNWSIYVLLCPITRAVRYVGWTNKSLQDRLRGHINETRKNPSGTHKRKWINSLLKQDLVPLIRLIESGSGDGWSKTERRWIQYYWGIGCALTNATNGGEGFVGLDRLRIMNLVGHRYGKLTVKAKVAARIRGSVAWLCVCACGQEKIISSNMLRTGHAKSCGCLNLTAQRETHTKHGMAGNSTWAAWKDMKRKYRETVCDRWRESFDHFLADMGVKPDGLRLAKINLYGMYEPGNCKWATLLEHASQTRRNRYVTVGDKSLTVSAWAREMGVSRFLIRDRLDAGLPPDLAVMGAVRA